MHFQCTDMDVHNTSACELVLHPRCPTLYPHLLLCHCEKVNVGLYLTSCTATQSSKDVQSSCDGSCSILTRVSEVWHVPCCECALVLVNYGKMCGFNIMKMVSMSFLGVIYSQCCCLVIKICFLHFCNQVPKTKLGPSFKPLGNS